MEYIGRCSIEKLKTLIKGKVLFFTQDGIYQLFQDKFLSLDKILYTKMSENPKREEIQIAQDSLKACSYEVIVAFGGGSVIDFAKAFRFYEQKKCPLMAIPTTAGTGSQATQFAVVYVDGVKTSLDEPSIKPDDVIIDSQFVEKSPKYLKACCAMDAFCQGIESFWAKGANDESKKYAIEAISLCRDWLKKAVLTEDQEANEKMALAAHLAGKAINISRTTAAHALSYKITSKYGVPHGHAVALCMAGLLKANQGSYDEQTLKEVIGNIDFHLFMTEIGLEYDLKKLNIFDIDEIVDSVNINRLKNNPQILSREDLKKILLGN